MFENRLNKREEAGFVSVELIVAFAFSMILLAGLTNLILVQYGRGVLRAAVDESARSGAHVADGDDKLFTKSIAQCRQRQADILKGLGTLATVTASTCRVGNGRIQSSVTASFKPWIPGIPTITTTATAISVKEKAPA